MISATVFVVPVLTVLLASSTVALDMCSDSIISKLKECYTNGTPPKQDSSGGLGTHIWISKGELPSNTRCVTASQNATAAAVTLYFTDDSTYSYSYAQEAYDDYVLETDATGKIKYRLYVIHNENGAYSYYRCIQEGVKGTGTPMGDIAIGCGLSDTVVTVSSVAKSLDCFTFLGITNLIYLEPCDC